MLEWLVHCFLKVIEGCHNSWNLQSEFFLITNQKVQKSYKWAHGAEDAFGCGNMLEWLVKCFIEALEENLIFDMFRINQKVKIFV